MQRECNFLSSFVRETLFLIFFKNIKNSFTTKIKSKQFIKSDIFYVLGKNKRINRPQVYCLILAFCILKLDFLGYNVRRVLKYVIWRFDKTK